MNRKKLSNEEKITVVLEMIRGGDSVAAICARHGVSDIQAYRWQEQFLTDGRAALSNKRRRGSHDPMADENRRLKELVIDAKKDIRGRTTVMKRKLADKIRLMRSHGMTTLTSERHKGHAHSYDLVELGYNYRIDEIRSAIGLVQLEKIDRNNQKRKQTVDLYRNEFVDIPNITPAFKKPSGNSSYHIFPVLLDTYINHEKLIEWLKEKRIQSSIHYPPIHLFEFYRRTFGFKEGLLPVTEKVAESELTLPLYPSMTEQNVRYVCDSISEYME